MSTTVKKYKIQQLQDNNDMLELHPETDADIVNYSKTIDGTPVTTVKGALDKIAEGIGVTGVKGNAEQNYRTGQVNITPANIGLGNVTNDKQIKGKSSGTTANNIVTWGDDGYTVKDSGVGITIGVGTTATASDTKIPTEKAVRTAIQEFHEEIQDVLEVAEGKTKNIVISYAAVTGYRNGYFNSTSATLDLAGSGKIKDVNGNDINFSDLTVGDIISVVETNVPDRWIGSVANNVVTFYPLEINISIDSSVIQNSTNPVSSGAVYTKFLDYVKKSGTNIVNDFVLKAQYNNYKSELQFAHDLIKLYQAGSDGVAYSLDFPRKTQNTTLATLLDIPNVSGFYTKPSGGIPISDLSGFNIIELSSDASTITQAQYTSITERTLFKYNAYYFSYIGMHSINNRTYKYFISFNSEVGFNTIKLLKLDTLPSSNNTTERSYIILDKTLYTKPSGGIPSSDLANSGVTVGTYSAVTVNAKGLVTAGGQIVEVGSSGQTTPSASLAVGGIFFKEI